MSDDVGYPDGYTDMEGRGWKPWLIAQEVELHSDIVRGKFIVEDVEESPDAHTVTYKLIRADTPSLPYWTAGEDFS